MTVKQLLYEKRADIERIAARHGAYNIRVFGSVVREEEDTDSDIDFVVEVSKDTSPWFPAGLILDLEDLLGRNVEIVTERALNQHIKQTVLREAESL